MGIVAERSRLRACIDAALTPHDSGRIPGVRTLPPDADSRRLLARWEKVVSGRGARLDERLAARGLDRESALLWLAPRRIEGDDGLPDWATLLLQVEAVALAGPMPPAYAAWTQAERAAYDLDAGSIPVFPTWLHPFVTLSLRAMPPAALAALAPGEARGSLARAIVARLSHLASRALSREIARVDVDEPAGDMLTEFLERYPPLARLLAQSALTCAEVFGELLLRASADRPAIASHFGGANPGRVAAIIGWRSDAHHGGRTAAFVTFESGLELVYKPRSHHIDLAFARFAEEAAAAGAPRLRLPVTLALQAHGWSEKLGLRDCEDDGAVDRFRERQGAIAAYVHFLCGMDFHYENFIPFGEWPVPIDLEALMSIGTHVPEPDARSLPRHLGPVGTMSVLSTSMGPYWRTGLDDQAIFVASGVGGCGERLWPQKVANWEGTPSRPRLAWRPRRYEFRDNLPRREGMPVGLDARGVESIAKGFRLAYRAISAVRERWLAEDGALRAFAGCRTRVVLRDTAEYASTLFWSIAPDHLASGRDYAVALEALTGELPQYATLTAHDVVSEDLACCLTQDVPAWHSVPESRLLLGPGGRSYGPVVAESPLDQAVVRLRWACAEDEAYQTEVLRTSLLSSIITQREELDTPIARGTGDLATILTGWKPVAEVHDSSVTPGTDIESMRQEVLAAARTIADHLAALALRLKDGTAWLGLTRVAGSASQLAPVVAFPWGIAGASGTALALANFARAFDDERYAQLARSALALADRTYDAMRAAGWWERVSVSGYTGAAFPIYAHVECARLLRDENHLERALKLAVELDPARLAAESNPDWLGGVAGTAAVLMGLHAVHPDVRVAARARACVAAIGKTIDDDGGFRVPGFERPLLGMAHGAAGIGAACARVYAATGDETASRLVKVAFDYERSRFDATAGDWPDQRRAPGESRFMSGWCSGPAGAGQARLDAREHGVAGLDAEVEPAIARTLERLGIDRHHACCGEAGRILFLASAASRLARPELGEAALRAAHATATFQQRHGFLRFQEFNDRPWSPGVLDGAAGVALALVAAVRGATSNPLSLGTLESPERT